MFSGSTVLERVSSKVHKFRGKLSFENDKIKVTILEGMLTDGASIPRIFWTIIGCPLDGKYSGSALIHDGLYGSHKTSKEIADKLFDEMLRDNGVGRFRRKLMYWAVKYFGSKAYYGKTKAQITKMKQYVMVELK